MPIDRTRDLWPGTTYNGFSGGAEPPPAEPARSRRLPTPTLMLGGAAVAVGLGLVFGVLARPELIGSQASASRPNPVAPSVGQVPIAVAAAPGPEPLPAATGRLETLPPEMAAAARLQAPVAAPNPAATPPTLALPGEPPAPEIAPPEVVTPPQLSASFDCAEARPGAEAMVCSDPALAAADRQLARAYDRALRVSHEPGYLRAEQQDWTAIREDAAQRSPHALASVYDQRIRELNEIAADARGVDGE